MTRPGVCRGGEAGLADARLRTARSSPMPTRTDLWGRCWAWIQEMKSNSPGMGAMVGRRGGG